MGRKYLLLGAFAAASLTMMGTGGAFAAHMDDMGILTNMSPSFGAVNINDVFRFYPEDPSGDNVPGGSGAFMTISAAGNILILGSTDDFDGQEVVRLDYPSMLDLSDPTLFTKTTPARFELALGPSVFSFDIHKLDLGTQKHTGLGGTDASVAPLAS